MRRKSFILFPLVVAAASLSLTGCSSGALPTPTAVSPSPHPVLSDEKLDTVTNAAFQTLESSDATLDAETLATRLSGPVLAQRRFEYQKKSLFGDAATLTALPTHVKHSAISQSGTYPHVVVQIMEAPEGRNYQWLNVLVQPTARDNWTLWATMQIVLDSNATAPVISTGDKGIAIVAADDAEGLVASPNAVVDAYIHLNQTREDANGLTFTDDSFRSRMQESQNRHAELVKDVGEAGIDFSRGQGPFSMRTDDGGALVLTEINHTTTIRVTRGGSVSMSNQDIIAAAGQAQQSLSFKKSLTISYSAALAFYVPPANAKDTTISLVAVSGSTPVQVGVS